MTERSRPAAARALNEEMWEVNIAFWEATGVFVIACECADPECTDVVQIPPEVYESIRNARSSFAVADGSGYRIDELPTDAAPADEVPLEFASHHFRALVAQLLDALPTDGREEALRGAGVRFGHHLADRTHVRPERNVVTALERVCVAVRTLGLDARLRDVAHDGAVIETPSCPLRPLVSERIDAALLDRGMWAGLADRALDGVACDEIRCETQGCLDAHESCVVLLRFARN